MSGRLYKRNVRVTVTKPVDYFTQEPNATVIEGLRVQFQVEKHLRSEPNTARVTISNLEKTARAAFERKPLYVRLDAGYDGSLERLCAGDVHHAASKREDTDWLTEMHVADGLRAIRFARVSRAYRGGVDAMALVREAARAFGLQVKASAAVQRELRAQLASGVVLDGRASDVMSRVLDPFAVSWSIQDGRLQILLPSEVRTDTTEIRISQDTGMIGSPDFGDPPEKGKRPHLMVRTQLDPRIAPGGRVRVESVAVRGLFKVLKVSHTGDTHGDDWQTEIECRAI